MAITMAFDVYGTLIDPHGVTGALAALVGEQQAGSFSRTWRSKQLEYTFRRALMKRYEEFPVCTRQALDYACRLHGCDLSGEEKEALMSSYLVLPAYDDVAGAMSLLRERELALYAFSNGVEREVRTLLENAGIIDCFDGIISVDEVQSFKPDPEVYLHFLIKTRSEADATWLVSSNPFDIIGAAACGWQTAWLKRMDTAVFDPWEVTPTLTVESLAELQNAG